MVRALAIILLLGLVHFSLQTTASDDEIVPTTNPSATTNAFASLKKLGKKEIVKIIINIFKQFKIYEPLEKCAKKFEKDVASWNSTLTFTDKKQYENVPISYACFIRCWLEGLGIIGKDGVVDPELLAKFIEEINIKNKDAKDSATKVQDSLKTCLNKKPEQWAPEVKIVGAETGGDKKALEDCEKIFKLDVCIARGVDEDLNQKKGVKYLLLIIKSILKQGKESTPEPEPQPEPQPPR